VLPWRSMSKPKALRNCRVVVSDKQDVGAATKAINGQALNSLLIFAGMFITAGGGMGADSVLRLILVVGGIAVAWLAINRTGVIAEHISAQYSKRIYYAGLAMLAMLSLCWGWSISNHVQSQLAKGGNTQHNEGSSGTNIQHADTVNILGSDANDWASVNRKLDRLLAVDSSESVHLEDRYQFGFVLVAFSGETDATRVLPFSRTFDSDWKSIQVNKEPDGNIKLSIPKIRMRSPSGWTEPIGIGNCVIPAVAGTDIPLVQIPYLNLAVHIECIKAQPIGVCVVIGFAKVRNSR
jgi:hypothetical protein